MGESEESWTKAKKRIESISKASKLIESSKKTQVRRPLAIKTPDDRDTTRLLRELKKNLGFEPPKKDE